MVSASPGRAISRLVYRRGDRQYIFDEAGSDLPQALNGLAWPVRCALIKPHRSHRLPMPTYQPQRLYPDLDMPIDKLRADLRVRRLGLPPPFGVIGWSDTFTALPLTAASQKVPSRQGFRYGQSRLPTRCMPAIRVPASPATDARKAGLWCSRPARILHCPPSRAPWDDSD